MRKREESTRKKKTKQQQRGNVALGDVDTEERKGEGAGETQVKQWTVELRTQLVTE